MLLAATASPQLPAVLAELLAAISSVSRVTKRQGCSGLKDLASTLGPALGEASSGRRLIRRVLSHIPGRTWEGKEELLEAVVALCKAGKGSAVSLEPFMWGEPAFAATSSGDGSRGLKRGRNEEMIGNGQDETEAEEDEEEHDEGEDRAIGEGGEPSSGILVSDAGDAADSGEGVGATVNVADVSAAEGAVRTAAETGPTGSEEDDGAASADGIEAAFLYQDKLGYVEDGTVVDPGASVGASVVAEEGSVQSNSQVSSASSLGHTRPEEEDDWVVPFGEVAALMLTQLNR